MYKRPIKYPPCSIVCHGLCEVRIVEYLRARTRSNIRPFSKNNGTTSLEVQNLAQQMCGILGLRNEVDFCKAYHLKRNEFSELMKEHRIFILMDKDAANDGVWDSYKNKTLLRDLWLAPYAVPIFFEPNLDEVSKRAGHFIAAKDHKPDQVTKFLLDKDFDYLEDLAKRNKETNLSELLDFLKRRKLL